jgi:phosphatidylglycerol:prolipoprotein diacylglycerol transferase
LVGFVGARLTHLLVEVPLESLLQDPLSALKIWEGGLVFYGGPLAVIPFVVFYTKKHKLPMWKTMDVMAPGLVIAHAFGRLGCFGAGCCHGKPTDVWWGVKFHSELVEKYLRGVAVHPTQLYESFGLFWLFLGLIWIYRIRRIDGQVVLSYLLTYPILRSIIEEFRGDEIRGHALGGLLSTSQLISLLVFLGAVGALILRLRTSPEALKKGLR